VSSYGNLQKRHLFINAYFKAVQTNSYQHISDQELLDKFRQDGNNQWLGIVLQRYTLLLLGVCMKYLKNEEAAKDAVQQVFLKSIAELQKYEVAYVKSWLYTIARNHCLMQLRNKNKMVPVLEDTALAPDQDFLEAVKEKELVLQELEQCLEGLNEPQKTCVILFYLQKKSYQEIVDQTGFNLLQVKSYIQNGKRNLKILLLEKLQQHNG
jgi:RNA polymerase sigma-70 factor (ECF subfamily)